MKHLYFIFVLAFFLKISAHGQSQNMQAIPGPIIVCPAGEFNGHFHTPVPDKTMQKILQKANGDPCANIVVEYNGFSPQAQSAFQAAVDIWAYSIESPVTIRIEAHWQSLEPGTLGAAGPALVVRDFANSPNSDYFPVALANKIAGTDLYPGDPDIVSYFNSGANWYYGTDGNTPYNKYDLMSVVLHELGHGLGFISSSDYESGTGSFGLGSESNPLYYDRFLTNGQNGPLLINMSGVNLGNAFTSNNVYCKSSSAAAHLGGNYPKIYAPSPYEDGSSISHWDETIYGAGDLNSLMTPQIGAGEAIHNPGPTTLGFFKDMGWTICDSYPGDECETGNLVLSETAICPGTTATASLATAPVIPAGGGYAIYFYDIAADDGIFLYDVDLPYTFDNDLNGLLSQNGYTPFSGAFELIGYVYTDGNNAMNTICAESAQGIPFTFYTASDPACNPTPNCDTKTLTVSQTAICPGTTATASLSVPATIPAGGGYGIYFYDVAADDGIFLYGITMPYTFDNDLNGVLSANGYAQFEGQYLLTGYVYSDANNASNSICAESPQDVSFTFYSASDPACNPTPTCNAKSLVLSTSGICPGATATASLSSQPVIPQGGGYGIYFYDVAADEGILLYGINMPYTFNNDLNGVLSANGYPPFSGLYELTGVVYSDAGNATGSICAETAQDVQFHFYQNTDPQCTTGIEDVLDATSDWVVYPNPAQDEIKLKFSSAGKSEKNIQINDMSGRRLYHGHETISGAETVHVINIGNLAEGIYLISVYSENGVETRRIVISR